MKPKVKKMSSYEIKIKERSLSSRLLSVLTSASSGFTLLEIMIALAIIGTALTVIVHTVNYHTNIMYENILTTRMFQQAKEKMNELETAPQNSTGTIDTTGLSYENTATPIKDTRFVELRTVVKGHGRQVVLNELVINRAE
ncbi:MAG: prepilin-type N-terminal cleavage/methylation domain-containing protein [Nitrospirae bacterium]|nr:prepilin-type N-terminal cleavage/methylation domain-containing protein [Nitrospirota bacterium]